MATTYLTAEELARLERMVGEAHKDVGVRLLADADMDDAAYLARTVDSAGEAPQDADGTANALYVNTVDLYKAASILWMQKASIFAEQFTFTADGGTFQRNQAYHAAVAQAKRYADMASGWTPVTSAVPVETS